LHARNGEEKKIGNYKLDGWHEETQTAYEFHGCVFHSCPRCYNQSSFNALKNELMSQTYLKHVKRMTELAGMVNKVVEIWECDYKVQADSDPMMQKIIDEEKGNIKPPKRRISWWKNKCYYVVLRRRRRLYRFHKFVYLYTKIWQISDRASRKNNRKL
jgi:G:T-mismatch repair DNA endonuclease (very short patch repair protein)